MLLLRKYLIGSFVLHMLVVFIASLVALRTQNIKQTFVVFGASSGKPSAVSYKSFKKPIPFITNGSTQSKVQNTKTVPTKKISGTKSNPNKKGTSTKISAQK